MVKIGLEDLAKVVIDYGTASADKRKSVPTGTFVKVYEGPKKPPQSNLSMSFANKKLQNLKCC